MTFNRGLGSSRVENTHLRIEPVTLQFKASGPTTFDG